MFLSVPCPSCGRVLRATENLLGKQIRCSACQHVFVATASPSSGIADTPAVWESERETPDHSGKATASLVLGILGLIGWCLPIFGLPMTIVGLVLGIKGQNSSNHGSAVAGIVLNIIGLALSVVNAAIGAYLGATGQHPLLR
jgi:Domain of unknown function (DUF4190)